MIDAHGKYIDFDENQVAKIQKEINKKENLKSDLKSEIENPQDVNSDAYGLEMGNHGLFDAATIGGERDQEYSYYKEMDRMEFIHRALEIVADDSTQANSDGHVLKVYSDDEEIKNELEEMFEERLDMDNELWRVVFDTSKMGDNFFEVVPDNYENPEKIIHIRYLEPENVERIEEDGKLSHFQYRQEIELENSQRNSTERKEVIYKLQPWQVVHFKVLADRESDPYGTSLLKPGIRTFRRLSLLEDVILVYRISRAPERRVFKINVGNMNYADAQRFVQKIKEKYRSQSFIDENGNLNKKANMLSVTSDIFIPVKEGGEGTSIDTLQGGEALSKLEDLDYFKEKILRTMNIPRAYLGDEADRSRGSLANQDQKFGRFIERIQAQITKGLNKIAALDLYFKGYKKDQLADFRIELTAPSNIKELVDLELINQRMGLISQIQGLNIYSNDWILRNIMKHSEREIAEIKMEKQSEQDQQQEEQPDQFGMEPGMDAGGMEGEAGGMEDMGEPGEEPATPEPGEEEAEGGEEEGGEEEMETASTIINMFGREFLMENRDDFFKLIAAAKRYNKEKKMIKEDVVFEQNPLVQHIAESVTKPIRSPKKNKTPEIKKDFILNEMGGLNFENKKKKSINLYENSVDEDGEMDHSEKEVLFS